MNENKHVKLFKGVTPLIFDRTLIRNTSTGGGNRDVRVTWQDSYHLYLPPMTLDNSALIFLTCSLLCRPWDFRWGNFAGLTLIQFVFLAPLWPFVSYAETLKYQASQRTNPDNPSIANVFSWSETARNKVRQPRIKCFIHQLLFCWYWQRRALEIFETLPWL